MDKLVNLCADIARLFQVVKNSRAFLHMMLLTNLLLFVRFADMFPDIQIVREVQTELDTVIEEGVANIVHLLKNQVLIFNFCISLLYSTFLTGLGFINRDASNIWIFVKGGSATLVK